MKRIVLSLFLLIQFSLIAQNNNPAITKEEIKDHITYLASDELEGRFSGSKGEKLAGDYIAKEFQSYGLKTMFGDSYFQEFDFTSNIKLGENNFLTISFGEQSHYLKINDDFITAPFSGNGKFEGEIVFAGYGISSDKLNYDDYEGIDVKDKFVLVMRYNPDNDSTKSEFDAFSALRRKASIAKDKGAKGIIFVNGFKPAEDDNLVEFKYDRSAGIDDFPAVHVKRDFADKLIAANGKNFKEIQAEIDNTKKPNSFLITDGKANVETEVIYNNGVGRNVVGWIEGSDPELKNEYIVLGAHYDHLGYGEVGSLYRGDDILIHNGADDNASGTTGLLELAEKFASDPSQIKRSIIFMAFSGEELGLLGSIYIVNNSPVNIENIAAMLNMDMIGRLNEDTVLNVIGVGTSTNFKSMLEEKNSYGFNLSFTDDGFGGSDHQSFTNKNIPVLFFFTGTHEDYHKPSDDTEKINFAGQEDIVKYVYDITVELSNTEARPDYVQVKREAPRAGYGGKVYVGTVPEFGYEGKGFKLSGVSDGGPAQLAGLQGGDIMIKFGKKDLENIYDFMYAMSEYSPGDEVDVVVLRDGEEKTFTLKLQSK